VTPPSSVDDLIEDEDGYVAPPVVKDVLNGQHPSKPERARGQAQDSEVKTPTQTTRAPPPPPAGPSPQTRAALAARPPPSRAEQERERRDDTEKRLRAERDDHRARATALEKDYKTLRAEFQAIAKERDEAIESKQLVAAQASKLAEARERADSALHTQLEVLASETLRFEDISKKQKSTIRDLRFKVQELGDLAAVTKRLEAVANLLNRIKGPGLDDTANKRSRTQE
jgi:hypothetical protein